jgi:ankyrin repeat protein
VNLAYQQPTAEQGERLTRFLNALNDGDALDEASAYLDAGGDIDGAIMPFIESALMHQAAVYRRLGLIEMLAGRGADLNVRDSFGMTPMHFAVQHEVDGMLLQGRDTHFPCARLLLDLGASKDVLDNHGRTPRDLAGIYGPAMLDLFDDVMK